MARSLAALGLCLLACAPATKARPERRAAPKKELPPGVWQDADDVPESDDPLPRREEPAPGRSDGPNGMISGFCPPRAEIFILGKGGRALVFREPCSGPTSIVLRDGAGEHPLQNSFYGVGGKWKVLRLPGKRL